mmetsp:Transcript_33490/g.61524  ORF Transcript_33490/g.61524 Transcript_33490/m.61524 type:complete len:136 (+) Transcript_33490:218-625(+)|eukprot:CAMPEP_0201618444 /NCGR_PEP_ID=MMETSP0492-20130828/38986_1 /ASSEMBLY_ACC=CAM_ASM_000837 /TAXON_ID=420259 /ORGANISM="Thalassiosira gravida, Strain GMp14c1" /LENGTH=135 /DNA_ID=CAMNT_0048087033 /DNA_START=219 /DNA_END=626 /DNA_ORIENTATION=+
MFKKSNPSGNYSQVSNYSDSDSSSDDGNPEDDFVAREIRQQKMMMKEQDQGLEMLGQSAERLSQISFGIHEELGHQTKMIDEMEEDLETATENLSAVTIKTRELVRKSGGKRNFIIIVTLTIVVVVLLFLVIYGV